MGKWQRWGIALVIGLALVMGSSTAAQDDGGFTIRGVVARTPDCTGARLAVEVGLAPLNESTRPHWADGRFSFDNVPDGSHTLAIDPPCARGLCWPEQTVTVSGADVEVTLCPEDKVEVPHNMTAPGMARLGAPDAPVQVMVFQNFTCGHCRFYHQTDLAWFIEDYVVPGQASVQIALMAFGVQPASSDAAYAALCASEQGAYWDMEENLFELAARLPPMEAFAMDQIRTTAEYTGLDADELITCVESERYRDSLTAISKLAMDLNVRGTPTALIRYDSDGTWQIVPRSYEELQQRVAAVTNDDSSTPYDFALPALDGDTVALKDFRGQHTVVTFWRTDCPACLDTLAALRAYTGQQDDPIAVLAINAGQAADTVRAFAEAQDIPFPVLLDADQRVVDAYGVTDYPTTVLMGPQGMPWQLWGSPLDLRALDDIVSAPDGE